MQYIYFEKYLTRAIESEDSKSTATKRRKH